tara:strand:+ start:1312 stop:1881 length:570 start_codon:yes stop_codon:yes gene_type:complete
MKEMAKIDLFKTPVTVTELDVSTSKLKSFCKIYKNKNITKSNAGGYHSEFLDITVEPLKSLFKLIDAEVYKYSTNLLNLKEVFFDNAWYIVNPPNAYNKIHSHPHSTISGAFYIDVPKNSGDIVFYNPNDVEPYLYKESINKFNDYNASKYMLPCKEKNLIIFPAWLKHEVLQNMSKKNRKVLSFNYKC